MVEPNIISFFFQINYITFVPPIKFTLDLFHNIDKTTTSLKYSGWEWAGSARWVIDLTQNFEANGSPGSASSKIWVSRAGIEWPVRWLSRASPPRTLISHGSYVTYVAPPISSTVTLQRRCLPITVAQFVVPCTIQLLPGLWSSSRMSTTSSNRRCLVAFVLFMHICMYKALPWFEFNPVRNYFFTPRLACTHVYKHGWSSHRRCLARELFWKWKLIFGSTLDTRWAGKIPSFLLNGPTRGLTNWPWGHRGQVRAAHSHPD